MTSTPRAPGIYFGLDEDEYHADPSLGSTNLKKLRSSAPDYWWGSHMNPLRPKREEKSHFTFGKAVHGMVLEGRQAFDARFLREPDGLIVTDDDVTKWLAEQAAVIEERGIEWGEQIAEALAQGIEPTSEARAMAELFGNAMRGKLPKTKGGKVQLAGLIDPDAPILDLLRAKADATRATIIKADDYDRIIAAGTMIQMNPDLATAFTGGEAEVSIFWRKQVGDVVVPCKARIDYLKVRGNGDLKSIANKNDLPFDRACMHAIASYRYDMQASHYLDARAQIAALLAAGAVHGDHDPDWLARVAGQDEYGAQIVFFQSTDAPITWSCSLSPQNPMIEIGATDCRIAIENYALHMERFGPDKAWVLTEPVREADISEMPPWYARG